MKLSGNQEIEVKLRVTHPPALRRRLARLGARAGLGARIHETNTLFDTPQGGLAKHGQLLRLRLEELAGKARGSREASSRAVLTYKGPAEKPDAAEAAQGKAFSATRGKRYKVREELEVVVADPQQLRLILEALGLRGWFRYEKYRTTYRLPAAQRWAAGLQVELDETPIGNFVELEDPRRPLTVPRSFWGTARPTTSPRPTSRSTSASAASRASSPATCCSPRNELVVLASLSLTNHPTAVNYWKRGPLFPMSLVAKQEPLPRCSHWAGRIRAGLVGLVIRIAREARPASGRSETRLG